MSKANDTFLIHAGRNPQKYGGAVNTPVHRMSTVLFKDYAEWENAEKGIVQNKPYAYGRYGNDTTRALSQMIAGLEGGEFTVLTSCGLSAINLALQAFLSNGDHALVSDNVYSPTARWFKLYGQKYGIEVDFFSANATSDQVKKLIKHNTKILFLESPGSFTFEISDTRALTALAKAHNIISIGDNTWGAFVHFAPFNVGFDISIQSLTKYASGASDVMMGSVTCTDAKLHNKIQEMAGVSGNLCSSADDAALVLRGLRSLSVRLRQHEQNGLDIASFLQQQEAVIEVLHPALPSHPDHELWKRDFTGACGLFAFRTKSLSSAQAALFINSLQHFGVGYSWGGYESLILPAPIDGLKRNNFNTSGTIFRIHVGLENVDDLKNDLAQALDKING